MHARCCNSGVQPHISEQDARTVSDDLRLLAHPLRVQILGILAHYDGRACVCDIETALPVKQPTVSHHLRLLREGGLIDCTREGVWVYYHIRREALACVRARIAGLFDALV